MLAEATFPGVTPLFITSASDFSAGAGASLVTPKANSAQARRKKTPGHPPRCSPAADPRQALADQEGEIRRIPGGFCFFGDIAARSKICERQIGVDLTALVEEFVEVAVGEQSPVQVTACSHALRMTADRSCAVLR